MAISSWNAGVGDGAVYKSKTWRWSSISSTDWEPMDQLRVGTASDIDEGQYGNSATSMWLSAGYYGTLQNRAWDGTQDNGDYVLQMFQSFLEFTDVTVPVGQLLAAAGFSLTFADNDTTIVDNGGMSVTYYGSKQLLERGQVSSSLVLRAADWGGGFVSGDEWYNVLGDDLRFSESFVWWATLAKNQGFVMFGSGSEVLYDQVKTADADTFRYAMYNSDIKDRLIGTARQIGGRWSVGIFSGNNITSEGNVKRVPRLLMYTLPNSYLAEVLGASVQLSDGTHAWLEYHPVTKVITLKRRVLPTTAPVTIGTIPLGTTTSTFGLSNSAQGFELVRDNNDNLYVMGSRGDQRRAMVILAWEKQVSPADTWFQKTVRSFGATDYSGGWNNISADWNPGNGGRSHGVIVINASHRFGFHAPFASGEVARGQYGDMWTYTLAGRYAIDGTEGIYAANTLLTPTTRVDFWPRNVTGTGLDTLCMTSSKSVWSSFVVKSHMKQPDADKDVYLVHTNSNSVDNITFNDTVSSNFIFTGAQKHDSSAKIRVIHMGSETLYANIVNGVLRVRDVSNASSMPNTVDLTTQAITGFPTKEIFSQSMAWDAYFDKVESTVWVYYRDTQNPRKILCVGFNTVLGQLINRVTPRVVATNVGPSGSTIVAIRCPRKEVDERWVHLDLATVGADGTHTLTYVEDTFQNVAPDVPVVQDITPFDISSVGPVKWVFSDPNSADIQDKYEMEVRRTTDLVVVYDPAPTNSTLISGAKPVNGALVTENIPSGTLTANTPYQVRVRVHDKFGAISDWSAWKDFATSGSGGSVVITDPVSDGAEVAGSSYLVKWVFTPNTTSNSPQEKYQIKVYRVSDNVLLQNTGLITSTATEHNVTSLVSDVQQRIEVIITDVANQPSSPGTRTVLPIFGRPTKPMVTAEPQGPFIRIRIENPVPGTDQPQIIRNEIHRRQTGVLLWTHIANVDLNAVYDDYGVRSGIPYDYKVIGVA